MKDSYVADIGDFGKYALLNALAGNDLRLGVVWYRNVLEESTRHGRFTEYPRLRSCDAELYDSLSQILQSNRRTIAEIEKREILPASTLFCSNPVPAPERPCFGAATRSAQTLARESWFKEGFEKLAEAQLVFLDPDTGFAPTRVKEHHRSSVKYVFGHEIAPWLDRGQSIVLYQHQRRKTLSEQIAEQRKELSRTTKCCAVSFHRLSVRIYYILPNDKHQSRLSERLDRLLSGQWGQHFSQV